MRLLLSILLLLGLAVSLLGAVVWVDDARRWSEVFEAASDTGALQNQTFEDRLNRIGLSQSSVIGALVVAGAVISALATAALVVETRKRAAVPKI